MLDIKEIAVKASAIPGGVDLKDRQSREHIYKKCFVAKDFVKWLKNNGHAKDEYHANQVAKDMLDAKLFNATNWEQSGEWE